MGSLFTGFAGIGLRLTSSNLSPSAPGLGAFATGFNSSQYFATQFKKLKNCSPKEYRNEL